MLPVNMQADKKQPHELCHQSNLGPNQNTRLLMTLAIRTLILLPSGSLCFLLLPRQWRDISFFIVKYAELSSSYLFEMPIRLVLRPTPSVQYESSPFKNFNSNNMWLYVVACLIVLIAYYSLRRDPDALLGVYSQAGKWFWLKYAVFYSFVFLRRLGLAWNAGYGRKARSTLDELDDVQTLSAHPLAIDAGYFNGYNKDGYYLGAGIQRRPKGRIESLLFIRIPDLGILEWPHSPSTATVEGEPNTYSTEGGLRFIRRIAMKSWRVVFDGELQVRETKESKRVKFDLIWTATTDWFDFDTDMHAHPVCEAIARETWDRAFFDRLRDAHTTHHEQFGVLRGTITIDGRDERKLELKSMRDHSYGLYRDWNDFHRYILQYFAFDDGSHLALHLVSLKPTMTHLITGFLAEKDGSKTPVYSCDRPLYTIGEDGRPPASYEFEFTAGARRFRVKCEKVQEPIYYCGWKREARLHVYMCKATMNGVGGRGMCEFEYNNVQQQQQAVE